MTRNFYNDLAIPFDATADEIRKAYFLAAKRSHPDVNPPDQIEENFLAIQEAYQVLSDPKKRESYNFSLSDTAKLAPRIGFDAQFSSMSIPITASPQLAYVMLDIQSTEAMSSSPRLPVSLCLVIDQSTSMRGERMDQVKSNILRLVRNLAPQDLVSIIQFHDRAEVVLKPTRASNRETIEGSVRSIATHGATEILQGLQAGVRLLASSKEPASIRQILLLTDGQTYGDESACLELARQAAADGISISAFGIGDEWNDCFLDELTAISGQRAVFVQSAENLSEHFEQKLQALNLLYAKNVTLELERDPRAALKFAFRLQPSEAPLANEAPMPLGDVYYGKSLRLLFEFELKPTINEVSPVRLLSGQIAMEIPSMPVNWFRKSINYSRPLSTDPKVGGLSPQILQAMSRLTLYRMQEKARAEAAAGETEKAARRLHNLATHLLAQGNHQLAQTVLIEAEALEETNSLTPEGEKRIKYGTRSLFMLPSPEQNNR